MTLDAGVISGLLLATAIAQPTGAHAEPVRYLKRSLLFGTVEVPSSTTQAQPETFIAHRAGAKIEIALESSTPHYDDRSVDCDGGQLIYKTNRPSLFAYSCRVGADITYSVSKYGKSYRVGASDATEQMGYTIRYPASQKRYWDPIVAHMTRSLQFAR